MESYSKLIIKNSELDLKHPYVVIKTMPSWNSHLINTYQLITLILQWPSNFRLLVTLMLIASGLSETFNCSTNNLHSLKDPSDSSFPSMETTSTQLRAGSFRIKILKSIKFSLFVVEKDTLVVKDYLIREPLLLNNWSYLPTIKLTLVSTSWR